MKNIKSIKKSLLLGIITISSFQIIAQSSFGSIKGLIVNNEGEPVFGATIKITQGGTLIGGAQTDENGKYTYKPLNPGLYEVVAFGMEFSTQRVTNVAVKPEKTAYVDMKVIFNTLGGKDGIVITAVYTPPIIDNSMITGKSIDAVDLTHIPKNGNDLAGVLTNLASDVTQDADGGIHVRGGRAESTALIVDGVRTPHLTGISMLAVDNLSIITGGVPAQYGDAVNGVVIVTTRDYFSGIRTKRIHQTAKQERLAMAKREKQAILDAEKRKKEIELELEAEKTSN